LTNVIMTPFVLSSDSTATRKTDFEGHIWKEVSFH